MGDESTGPQWAGAGEGRHAREAQETREGRRSPLHTLESPATPSMLSSKRHTVLRALNQLWPKRPHSVPTPTGQSFPQLSLTSHGVHTP